MKKLRSPKDSEEKSTKMRKTGISDRERNKILSEIGKHEHHEPFYKRLFKKKHDEFTFLVNTGEHIIRVDPRYKIKSVELSELKEFCHASICGGGDNVFSYEINNDYIEIRANIVTNFAVLKVNVNKNHHDC